MREHNAEHPLSRFPKCGGGEVGLLGLGASILYAIMASVGGAKAICAANFPNRPGDCIRTCICGLPK